MTSSIEPSALEQNLREHVAAIRFLRGDKVREPYACIEEYVVKHGRTFTSQPFTPAELTIIFTAITHSRRRYPPRQCFANGQWLVFYDDSDQLQYVEGYVVRTAIGQPILHGWTELNGKVIDLTLRRLTPRKRGRLRDRILGEFDDREYLGVVFPQKAELLRLMRTRSALGTLLDDHRSSHHLLRGGALAEVY